jgi:hypothetical protein
MILEFKLLRELFCVTIYVVHKHRWIGLWLNVNATRR